MWSANNDKEYVHKRVSTHEATEPVGNSVGGNPSDATARGRQEWTSEEPGGKPLDGIAAGRQDDADTHREIQTDIRAPKFDRNGQGRE